MKYLIRSLITGLLEGAIVACTPGGETSPTPNSTDNPTIHVGELYTVRVPDPTPTGPR